MTNVLIEDDTFKPLTLAPLSKPRGNALYIPADGCGLSDKRIKQFRDPFYRIYLGCVFWAVLRHADMTIEQASHHLGVAFRPTVVGAFIFLPYIMRRYKITDGLERIAPELMKRRGMGDVVRLYEEKERIDPKALDPEIVDMIRSTEATYGSISERKCINARHKWLKETFRKQGPTPPAAMCILPAPPATPIKIDSLYDAVAQERLLSDPSVAAVWDSLPLADRQKSIRQKSIQLVAYDKRPMDEIVTECAANLCAQVRLDLSQQLPHTMLDAVIRAAADPAHKHLRQRARILNRLQKLEG